MVLHRLIKNKGNSLAEFAISMALMATLAATAAPAFSRIGESAKAKQTERNLETISSAARQYFNQRVQISGMGIFPGQAIRSDNVGSIVDDGDRRIEQHEIAEGEFISVWQDTVFLHMFDNDTIMSPYQDGRYDFAVVGGSGSGEAIQSPIFIVVDIENPEDFFHYFKP